MAIAKTLHDYIHARGIRYGALRHARTPSASRAAQAAHVSGDYVAKSVVLKNDRAEYVMAVLPASCRIALDSLKNCLQYDVEFASEEEVTRLFPDCEAGAVPALGDAYRITTLVDDSLLNASKVYIEGGDHKTLVYLVGEDFRDLVEKAPHASFSVHT